MRFAGILVIAGLSALPAATLQKLSLDDMIQKSTRIVRGKVTGSTTVMRGPVIYTEYRVQPADSYKGGSSAEIHVFVAGGKYGSVTQTFSGSPRLREGQEYVLFLWTSRSGLTQVIGLSQGLFTMTKDPLGEPVLTRNAASETMLDSSGKVVEDTPVSVRLGEMVDRIHRTLAGVSR